ncbi:LOW QUALITY PROTEIN: melanoma-associated antigen B1-like [Choloepus didactylus]|uniref:LOW QUALITY PROTEIN: melanoma-associated antigen B1-like n=1 Tax=Choloepus didactylus TaxID=27675 RepID=UPI0018A124C0|nr:LOW QUALITY PROTEIN: melanoma-associated antigen B1-like [Choloepus didactylus]
MNSSRLVLLRPSALSTCDSWWAHIPCPLSVTGVIQPHGQKSKVHACEKRCQARDENQGLEGAQATAAEEKESPSSSPVFGGTPQSSPATGIPQGPQGASPTITNSKGLSRTSSDETANSQDGEKSSTSQAALSTKRSRRNPLIKKAGLLEQFLLHKFKRREPIMKKGMLKIVNGKYKDRFPEILRRASDNLEVLFAVNVKEVDATGQTYALISKLDLPNNGRVSHGRGLPKTSLLMLLLGMIIMKGNSATEKEIWKFLNMMRIYAGKKHFIYGEPRKLITEDLVKLKYLEYRQVPNSYPPAYEFLWGSRAKQETSKMKVLEFLAKVNDTVPSAFSSQYEEAVREEEERAQARIADEAGTTVCSSDAPGPCPATPPKPSEA